MRKPEPGSNDPPHTPRPLTPQSANQAARLITVAEAEALAADPEGLYKAEWLLAAVRALRGIACASCGGHGSRAYGSTATWRGGAGGQAITSDVCDKCWGSGLRDRSFPSHKRMEFLERKLALDDEAGR